jgi:hypothetical protein
MFFIYFNHCKKQLIKMKFLLCRASYSEVIARQARLERKRIMQSKSAAKPGPKENLIISQHGKITM